MGEEINEAAKRQGVAGKGCGLLDRVARLLRLLVELFQR
jgi:hypothetical protein